MKTKSNRIKVYYRRIPDNKELTELMDAAILESAKGSFRVAEWLKKTYGVETKDVGEVIASAEVARSRSGVGTTPVYPEVQMAVKANESTFTGQFAKQVEEDSNKKMVKDLLDDNERLSREVAEWKQKELNWIKMDANEHLNYVVAMLTKCQDDKKPTNPYDQTTHD